MSPNSGAQRIVPIDEVEMGAGNLVFRDIVELRKKDAKAQEGIVDVIATVLEQSCTNNDSLQNGMVPGEVTVFHGQRPPNITARQYIERIAAYSGCSPCCLAMGMKYLDRLKEKDPVYELNSLNFHRLVLTSVLVASKFVDDFYYSNGYWSKVGGVKVDELNGMETEFLFLISFELHIKRAEYDLFVSELYRRADAIDPLRRLSSLAIRSSPTSTALTVSTWDGHRALSPPPHMKQVGGGHAMPGGDHPWGPKVVSPHLNTSGPGGVMGGVSMTGGAPLLQQRPMGDYPVPSPRVINSAGVKYAPRHQGPDVAYPKALPPPVGHSSSIGVLAGQPLSLPMHSQLGQQQHPPVLLRHASHPSYTHPQLQQRATMHMPPMFEQAMASDPYEAHSSYTGLALEC